MDQGVINYTTFLMKLGKRGDDEITVPSIKGNKGPKNNLNMHRQSSGESSQSDMKRDLQRSALGSGSSIFLVTLSFTQRAHISNVQIMPFVQRKTSEQTSFCDLLSVYLVSEAQACYSALFISHGTSACLSFRDHALKMWAN